MRESKDNRASNMQRSKHHHSRTSSAVCVSHKNNNENGASYDAMKTNRRLLNSRTLVLAFLVTLVILAVSIFLVLAEETGDKDAIGTKRVDSSGQLLSKKQISEKLEAAETAYIDAASQKSDRVRPKNQDHAGDDDKEGKSLVHIDEGGEEDVCAGYDGILFISRVFLYAGAGTLFFQAIVDSLLYADEYNLYPLIHINDDSNGPCYDVKIHGAGPSYNITHLYGHVDDIEGTGDMSCKAKPPTRPGAPDFKHVKEKELTIRGNGLWASYFEEPVIGGNNQTFVQHHLVNPDASSSCKKLPIFEMTQSQILPGMHRCSDLAVRGWTFKHIPKALLPRPDQSMHEWLWERNRARAIPIVRRHFRPLPWVQERVDKANPTKVPTTVTTSSSKSRGGGISPLSSSPPPRTCLSMHIRLTDKASGRDKKGLEVYLPYAKAWARATQLPIFVASDDSRVIEQVQEAVKEYNSKVLYQKGVMRSDSNTPTFTLLANDKHRSNTEALVEIYAMAKCAFFVHGYSGMAEAVVYVNPTLHERSVNIDDPEVQSPKKFRSQLKKLYPKEDGDDNSTSLSETETE